MTSPAEPLDRLRRDYSAAFVRHLSRRDEKALEMAYELGRRSLADGVRMLELVVVHHEAFLAAVATTSARDDVEDAAHAAAAFLLEALAPYEMAQRGFREAQRRRRPVR